jgi:predicted O-methyltransferase YrrM
MSTPAAPPPSLAVIEAVLAEVSAFGQDNDATVTERPKRMLKTGGLLVTDNVVSHADQVTEFLARLKNDPSLDSVTVLVGNGEELTYRRA